MKINFTKTSFVLFLIGALLFAYTCYRAIILSITWDEAFSYLEYIQHGIYIEKKFVEMSANNHWLNTWLCIHLTKAFGVNEFVLRIPSLLAHILFLFYSAKIVLRLSSKWLTIIAFLIINCNPYLLDFFSLSRGYALSVAFMVCSIYYLINYITREYKVKYAIYSLLAAAFAVLANFVLLNYFVVLFLLISFLLIIQIVKEKQQRLKKTIHFIVIENLFILILVLIVPLILKLRAAGAFYYGANNSFWGDTVNTAVNSCLYGLSYYEWVPIMLKTILIITLLFCLIYVIISMLKRKVTEATVLIFSLLFLVGITALAFIVQHHLLHSLYLIDRTTLFYVVLFSLLLVFTLDTISKKRKIAVPAVILIMMLISFHFIRAFNFSYVWEWKTNAPIKQMISDLEKEHKRNANKLLINVGAPLNFEMGLNFYRVTKKLYWLNTPERTEQTHILRDFWLLEVDSAKANKSRYQLINTYMPTLAVLAVPTNKPAISKTIYRSTLNYEFSDEGVYRVTPEIDYTHGFRIEMNDTMLSRGSMEVNVRYKVKVPYEDMNKTILALSIERNNVPYLWKAIQIKEYIQNKGDWNNVYLTVIVPKEIRRGDIIKSYIWNNCS